MESCYWNTKKPKSLKLLSHNANALFISLDHIVKVNLIEVNLAVVSMSSQNILGNTILKKNQTLLKFWKKTRPCQSLF